MAAQGFTSTASYVNACNACQATLLGRIAVYATKDNGDSSLACVTSYASELSTIQAVKLTTDTLLQVYAQQNFCSESARTRFFVAQGPAAVSGGEAAGVHRWEAECWALGPACLLGSGKPLPIASHTPLPFFSSTRLSDSV